MKLLVAVIAIIMFAVSASFATEQYSDKLIFESREYYANLYPMEPYFNKYPDKRPKQEGSTALYRGYVATFGFDNNILILKDIEIEGPTKMVNGIGHATWISVKSEVFPKGEKLKIDWLSDVLILPCGKLLEQNSTTPKYSNYILLEIKKGKLTEKRFYDNKQYEEFKKRQFAAYKKTEAYKKEIKSLKEQGDTLEGVDSFLRDYFVDMYVSEFIDKKEEEKVHSFPIYSQDNFSMEIISYGYGTVETNGKNDAEKDITSGHINIFKNFTASKQTDKIPAKIGNSFGVKYIVNGKWVSPEEKVKILLRLIHPPIIPPGKTSAITTEEVSLIRENGEEYFSFFKFEKEWEIMPGKWLFQFFHEGSLLAEKSFEIYKP